MKAKLPYDNHKPLAICDHEYASLRALELLFNPCDAPNGTSNGLRTDSAKPGLLLRLLRVGRRCQHHAQ